jgi:hypothetical protein
MTDADVPIVARRLREELTDVAGAR